MDWKSNTIKFDQIEQDKVFWKDFSKNKIQVSNDFQNAEYAIFWNLKSKYYPLDNLTPSDKLLYLKLNSSNLHNFIGIEKYKNLKRLETHYCLKLETDEGLGSLSNTIEFLHINQSKNFQFDKELIQLDKLKVLRLNDCGPIENLSFLRYFPKLMDFRFVNTNIIDGNLNPILEHPTLRTVGLNNKRHYNIKSEKLHQNLLEKFKSSYEKISNKDEYYPFR